METRNKAAAEARDAARKRRPTPIWVPERVRGVLVLCAVGLLAFVAYAAPAVPPDAATSAAQLRASETSGMAMWTAPTKSIRNFDWSKAAAGRCCARRSSRKTRAGW